MNKYFEILGLKDGASLSEIKKAYRIKAKLFHPDVNKSPDANEKFVEINEAYSMLVTLTNDKLNNHTKVEDNEFIDFIIRKRAEARQKARQNAQKRYKDFINSKEYKSAKIIYNISDFIYIIVSLIIVLVPIIYTFFNKIDEKIIEMYITALILTVSFGIVMLVFILKSNSSFLKFFKKIKSKVFTHIKLTSF